jgi:hypothetical protein
VLFADAVAASARIGCPEITSTSSISPSVLITTRSFTSRFLNTVFLTSSEDKWATEAMSTCGSAKYSRSFGPSHDIRG